MINGVVGCILALESISDIKNKSISIWHMIVFGVLGVVVNGIMYYQSLQSLIGGVVIGVLVLVFAFFSRGAIGKGDGVIFICIGIYLGLSKSLRLLFYSLIAAALVGGLYILVKKKSIKTQIPFVPCILIAHIAMTLMEVLS